MPVPTQDRAATTPASCPPTPPGRGQFRITRRQLLIVGGALTAVAAAGTLYRAADQGVFSVAQGPAFEPWHIWRADGSPEPQALVGAAILAANGHNAQPWRFRLGPRHLDLFGDPRRRTGAMDPVDREFWIGLGCALENLVLAARAAAYTAEVTFFPEPAQPWLAARVSLAPGELLRSELYDAIPLRHTNRAAYDRTRPIPSDVLTALGAVQDPAVGVRWYVTDADRHQFGELTVRAVEAFIADREQSEAAFAWYRPTWQDVQGDRDGLNLDGQALAPAVTVLGKLLPPASREQGDGYWLHSTRDVHVATAAAFGLLLIRQAVPLHWLRAGRDWQRLHLAATALGLALQPLDQVPIRAEREVQLGLEPRFVRAQAELVSDPGWQVALAFRIGYPTTQVPPSPRRPVAAVLDMSG